MNNIYDVLVIGAGPSGIGAAIKLHQDGVDVVGGLEEVGVVGQAYELGHV